MGLDPNAQLGGTIGSWPKYGNTIKTVSPKQSPPQYDSGADFSIHYSGHAPKRACLCLTQTHAYNVPSVIQGTQNLAVFEPKKQDNFLHNLPPN